MNSITVPLTGGSNLTLFIGVGHLVVTESTGAPNLCTLTDGLHNNGGWKVALPAAEVIKMIKEATKPIPAFV